VAISSAAQEEANKLVRNAKAELAGLENAVQSSRTYLKNLGRVISEIKDMEN
jgi:hypothetical protein